MLAPHRAFIEGRTALETFERAAVVRAQGVFERNGGAYEPQWRCVCEDI
jgi:hypothetical protein